MTASKKVATCFSPLPELLKAPLSKEDLEFDLEDERFLDEFEKAWAKFLKSNPDLIPQGDREATIKELQQEALDLEEGKLKVLTEMEQQVEFFKASCENLEEDYSKRMQEAIEKQKAIHDRFQKLLDDVATAHHVQEKTLPWHHFVHELDKAAATIKDASSDSATGNGPRPSARALVLTDRTKGSDEDIMLRAYKVDHALMTAHIDILAQEIERYQRMVRSQEETGRFLKEFNAWSILNKSGGTADMNSVGSSSYFLESASHMSNAPAQQRNLTKKSMHRSNS